MTGGTGRFTRADRLLRSRDFQHVTRQGRRATSRGFVLIACPRRHPGRSRLGLTVSRKVGNAVVRNRVKRRVREWFRLRGRDALSPEQPLDVVVIARREAVAMSQDELSRTLSALLGEAAAA